MKKYQFIVDWGDGDSTVYGADITEELDGVFMKFKEAELHEPFAVILRKTELVPVTIAPFFVGDWNEEFMDESYERAKKIVQCTQRKV